MARGPDRRADLMTHSLIIIIITCIITDIVKVIL